MAPPRQSQPELYEQATLKNYPNHDSGLFMRGETAISWYLQKSVYLPEVAEGTVVSSYVERWRDVPNRIAIEGLTGCHVIVLVSTRGALVLHLFEYPAFATWDAQNQRKGLPDAGARNRQSYDLLYRNTAVGEHWGGYLNFRSDSPDFQRLPSRITRDGDDVALMEDLLNSDAKPKVCN